MYPVDESEERLFRRFRIDGEFNTQASQLLKTSISKDVYEAINERIATYADRNDVVKSLETIKDVEDRANRFLKAQPIFPPFSLHETDLFRKQRDIAHPMVMKAFLDAKVVIPAKALHIYKKVGWKRPKAFISTDDLWDIYYNWHTNFEWDISNPHLKSVNPFVSFVLIVAYLLQWKGIQVPRTHNSEESIYRNPTDKSKLSTGGFFLDEYCDDKFMVNAPTIEKDLTLKVYTFACARYPALHSKR